MAARPQAGDKTGPGGHAPGTAPTAASGWTAPPREAERNSVAVLPFANLSGGQQDDYFSDGITEELTNALGELQGLRVAARTSAFQFKGQNVDIRDVGRRLGVANLLEGSVQRSGNKVRILARLVDAASGSRIWSGQVEADASDIFAAEDKISRQVADALQVKLALARVPTENARSADPVAHQTLLKAKANSKTDDPAAIQEAQRQYRQVVERDPGLAPEAWAGMAQNIWKQGSMGLMEPGAARDSAWRLARHALRLDSTLTDAHMILARTARDLDTRARELQRALDLNPNNAEARAELGEVMAARGQTRAAMAQAREAMRLDPLGSRGRSGFQRVMVMAGHPDEARVPMPPMPPGFAALNDIPKAGSIQADLCAAFATDPALQSKAPEICETARKLGSSDPGIMARVALGYARLGRRQDALESLHAYERIAGGDPARAVRTAAVYAALGDADAAFAALGKEEPATLRTALRDPGLAPLRQDPRFAELQRRVGG